MTDNRSNNDGYDRSDDDGYEQLPWSIDRCRHCNGSHWRTDDGARRYKSTDDLGYNRPSRRDQCSGDPDRHRLYRRDWFDGSNNDGYHWYYKRARLFGDHVDRNNSGKYDRSDDDGYDQLSSSSNNR